MYKVTFNLTSRDVHRRLPIDIVSTALKSTYAAYEELGMCEVQSSLGQLLEVVSFSMGHFASYNPQEDHMIVKVIVSYKNRKKEGEFRIEYKKEKNSDWWFERIKEGIIAKVKSGVGDILRETSSDQSYLQGLLTRK